MAEGDSIARLAGRLRAALVGAEVASSRFAVASLATADLGGRRIDGIESRGKHLLLRLGPRGHGPRTLSPRPVTLHLHLRMDGALRIVSRPPAVGHEVRMTLSLADGRCLVGERVPVVELVDTTRESEVVGHLGPDLCAPGWSSVDAAAASRRLLAAPRRPLVEALLDQRNLAGIGNLYAVEGCFLSGLWPWVPVGEVAERIPSVVDLEHRLLAAGVAGSGQATTGDRRRGHTHWVYGRKDRPCRRCGTTVRFWPGDGGPATRPTWWCPRCQPRPSTHPCEV